RIGNGDRDLAERPIKPAKPCSLKLLIFVLLHDWVRDKKRLRLRKDQSLRNEPTVAHENRQYFYRGAVHQGLTLGVAATVSILVVAIMAGPQIAAGPSVR